MALVTVKKVKHVQKKINLEEEVYNELKTYIKFLDLSDDEAIESEVINQSLKYLFNKDKDFKKYKEQHKNDSDISIKEGE